MSTKSCPALNPKILLNLESENSKKGQVSYLNCTVCEHKKEKSQVFPSRSLLLSHTSNHFRKSLTQKHVGKFISGQNCKFCEKVQKSRNAYVLHLGARHE